MYFIENGVKNKCFRRPLKITWKTPCPCDYYSCFTEIVKDPHKSNDNFIEDKIQLFNHNTERSVYNTQTKNRESGDLWLVDSKTKRFHSWSESTEIPG